MTSAEDVSVYVKTSWQSLLLTDQFSNWSHFNPSWARSSLWAGLTPRAEGPLARCWCCRGRRDTSPTTEPLPGCHLVLCSGCREWGAKVLRGTGAFLCYRMENESRVINTRAMGSQWWYQGWGPQGEEGTREAGGPCGAGCSPGITAVLGPSLSGRPSHRPCMKPAQELPWHPPSGPHRQVLAVSGLAAVPGDQGAPAAGGLQDCRPQCGHRHRHPGRGRGLPSSPEARVTAPRLVPLSLPAPMGTLRRSWLHGLLLCTRCSTPGCVCVPVVGAKAWHFLSWNPLSRVSFCPCCLQTHETSHLQDENAHLDPTQLCQTGCNQDLSLTHGCKRTSVENFTWPVGRLCPSMA